MSIRASVMETRHSAAASHAPRVGTAVLQLSVKRPSTPMPFESAVLPSASTSPATASQVALPGRGDVRPVAMASVYLGMVRPRGQQSERALCDMNTVDVVGCCAFGVRAFSGTNSLHFSS
jgi:hypothetical protein